MYINIVSGLGETGITDYYSYWIINASYCVCSCSSTTQWRDWGQVWEAWMISNPTLSLPEWTGPNRRCALWDCGNQSCMVWDRLSRMRSFQTENTNRQEIQNMHFCTHLPFYIRPFSLHIFLFIRNLPRSSITFLVNCSFLYLIEGLLCNLCGAGNTSQHARSHLYNKSWYRVMIPYDVVTFTVAVSQIDTSERWRVCLHCIY